MSTPKLLLLSIPLVLAWTLLLSKPAPAAPLGPVDATEHLAKARATDAKCHFLAETDREELSGYAARAEVVVASKEGVDVARSAVKTGELAGQVMPCTTDSEKLVRSSLEAGRQAAQSSRSGAVAERAPEPEPQAPQRLDPNASQIIGGLGNEAEARPGAYSLFEASQSRRSLARYQHEATAYYLELRCRHLRNRQVREFWDRIVAKHQAMLQAYGGRKVMRAQAEAEAVAARRPCGPQSASFIDSAYAGMR